MAVEDGVYLLNQNEKLKAEVKKLRVKERMYAVKDKRIAKLTETLESTKKKYKNAMNDLRFNEWLYSQERIKAESSLRIKQNNVMMHACVFSRDTSSALLGKENVIEKSIEEAFSEVDELQHEYDVKYGLNGWMNEKNEDTQ
jgi:hypothetical protein